MLPLMAEGAHSVTWYINDQPICTKTLTITGDTNWNAVFDMPSASEISAANQTSPVRSPYIAGQMSLNSVQHFTEYSVDFKADYLPEATYCSLANMTMDLSDLKARYKNVHTEYDNLNMYAGFQRTWGEEKVSILSFWDVYYTDENGNPQTLRARLVYPANTDGNDSFSGEGTGAHVLVPYDWQAGHWYRMLLQCRTSPDTGTTLVDQWVCDLETGAWTLLCTYDTLLHNSCFTGPLYVFLENFDNRLAGEIRSMEVANIRLRDASSGRWTSVSAGHFWPDGAPGSYRGSYALGAQGNRFWAITSGAGRDAYAGSSLPAGENLSVSGVTASDPY